MVRLGDNDQAGVNFGSTDRKNKCQERHQKECRKRVMPKLRRVQAGGCICSTVIGTIVSVSTRMWRPGGIEVISRGHLWRAIEPVERSDGRDRPKSAMRVLL